MQDLLILRDNHSNVIRVLGTPDGDAHFSLIQDGKVISTRPIPHRKSTPVRTFMPAEYQDTVPTGPTPLEGDPRVGHHNYLETEWELRWTKRLLITSIIVAVLSIVATLVL